MLSLIMHSRMHNELVPEPKWAREPPGRPESKVSIINPF